MSTDQSAYFLRHERQERRLADESRNPGIRRMHLELATRYADLIADTGPTEAGPEIVVWQTVPRS